MRAWEANKKMDYLATTSGVGSGHMGMAVSPDAA
jgi:hypothetical protein